MLRGYIVSSSSLTSIDRQIVSSLETINRNYRLDPSRYNEAGEKRLRHLKLLRIKTPKLRELEQFKEIYVPNRFSRTYITDSEHGVPMLGTSSMFMIRLPNDARIKIEGDIDNSPLRIKEGDILISRSGTVGTVVLCGKSYNSFVASDHCFRLRMDPEMQGFVSAYIKSPFGRLLLQRDSHGKVILELKARDIENVIIPLFDDNVINSINNLMLQAARLTDIARESLDKAEAKLDLLFRDSISNQLRGLWLNEDKSFLKPSCTLFNNRLDPHYYDPNVHKLRALLKTLPHKTLGEIAKVWGVSRFKRHRTEKGYGEPLYSSSDIMRAKIEPSTYISRTKNARNIEQCKIKQGTILVPCSGTFGGILGRSVVTSNRLDGKVITQHCLRIQVKHPDFIPEYIAAILGSWKFGYPIITAYRHGKDIPEISPEEIKAIPIPFIDLNKQEGIAVHVIRAIDSIDRANSLEDQAQEELLNALKWNSNESDLEADTED